MKPKLAATKFIVIAVAFFTFIDPALGYWRHLCHGQLGMARIDPMMAPGKPSQHIHNIQGASNFDFDVSFEGLSTSNCTSCSISQDKSAYWSPQMYFQHDNGTFELVATSGGLTAYYFTESPKAGTVPVIAFPKNFRMIAGNSTKRAFFGPDPDPPMAEWTDYDRTQQSLMEKSIGFNCLNYAPGHNEGSMQHHNLREKTYLDANCPEGIRAELQFPSCWDGVNVDSKNHTTHVAYPYELRDGDCPAGYPVRLPTLFYETIYQTNAFKEYPGQFVFAQGDPTGYGYHGDFINGWDDGVLQQAIYRCTNGSGTGLQEDCPVFHIKPDSEVVTCKLSMPEALESEQINLVSELPGGCQIQSGVDFATMPGMPTMSQATTTLMAMKTVQYWTATNTSADANTVSSAMNSSAQFSYSTSAVAPPDTTQAPTVANNELTTLTSVMTSDGTVIHYVIVEEVVTTTVVVDGAGPTPGATPADPIKRHIHAHSSNKSRVSSIHSHGVRVGKTAKRVRGY